MPYRRDIILMPTGQISIRPLLPLRTERDRSSERSRDLRAPELRVALCFISGIIEIKITDYALSGNGVVLKKKNSKKFSKSHSKPARDISLHPVLHSISRIEIPSYEIFHGWFVTEFLQSIEIWRDGKQTKIAAFMSCLLRLSAAINIKKPFMPKDPERYFFIFMAREKITGHKCSVYCPPCMKILYIVVKINSGRRPYQMPFSDKMCIWHQKVYQALVDFKKNKNNIASPFFL